MSDSTKGLTPLEKENLQECRKQIETLKYRVGILEDYLFIFIKNADTVQETIDNLTRKIAKGL